MRQLEAAAGLPPSEKQPVHIGLGFQVYGRPVDSTAPKSAATLPFGGRSAIGHWGVSGSIALVDLMHGLSVVVLINTARPESNSSVTRTLVSIVYQELGLDPPVI